MIQGYCLWDSGLNAIAVRGNITAGRSSTRNSHRGPRQLNQLQLLPASAGEQKKDKPHHYHGVL